MLEVKLFVSTLDTNLGKKIIVFEIDIVRLLCHSKNTSIIFTNCLSFKVSNNGSSSYVCVTSWLWHKS